MRVIIPTRKNPDGRTTGDEEMTGAQRSYLDTLSQEAGEEPRKAWQKQMPRKKMMPCN
jgi:hypothetical protein